MSAESDRVNVHSAESNGGNRLMKVSSMKRIPVALLLLMAVASVARPDAARPDPAGESQIQEWIERLGADQYAQREKARDQLQQLGVAAFEALHAAQYHSDVEIRKQAEYLLRAIRIAWTQEDDPDTVKQLLRRYQQDDYEDRQDCLHALGRITHGQSIGALCRLARFETSEILSKKAALEVMRMSLEKQQVDTDQLAEKVEPILGNSQRTAAKWLRLYARHVLDPESTMEQWRQLASAEVDAFYQRPEKEHLEVVRDLLRWQIEALQRLERDSEMLAVLKQLLPLQGTSRNELLPTMDWIIDRQAWSLIDDLVEAYPAIFEDDPYLIYRRAEAALQQGQDAEAQVLAAKSMEFEATDEPFLHVELGIDLQNRGLIPWAEQEYRLTIKNSEQGTHPPVEAAIRLGWMFHDLARNHEASETFRQLVELMDQNKDVVRRVQELNRNPLQVRGQMHFSNALDLADQMRWGEHRAELEQALKYDRENADILIAMHRVPDVDDQWNRKTDRRIEILIDTYAQHVARAERDARTVPGTETSGKLAQALNQFAWLVSNTKGDYEAALRSSQRSLELVGESAGYLDTLARCYYAVGDFAEALKIQRRAIELEPHTGQIRRQYEFFTDTVEQQGPGQPFRGGS